MYVNVFVYSYVCVYVWVSFTGYVCGSARGCVRVYVWVLARVFVCAVAFV